MYSRAADHIYTAEHISRLQGADERQVISWKTVI